MYGRGKSQVHPVLVTYTMKNRTGTYRIGVTTSKKIGNAVKRNRARRVIMAAWRNLLPLICESKDSAPNPRTGGSRNGYDIVFVARVRTTLVKSSQIEQAMKKHLTAAGIFIN